MALELDKTNLMTPEPDANGNAITYWQPNFPDDIYFHINANGEAEMFAATNGASSANSSRARTEFREIVPGTTIQKNWTFSSGKHTLRVADTVIQLPLVEETICIGQVHVKNSTGPAAKFVIDRDNLKFSFRESFEGAVVNHVVYTGLQIGDRVNFSIVSTVTGKVYLYLSVNGVTQPTTSYQLDSTWVDKLLYFKAGVYVLEDPTETTSDEEGGKVVMDKLEFVHEE